MNVGRQVVFIVGAPRSGTTWLLSLLELHSQCRAITPEAVGISSGQATKETGVFLRGLKSDVIVDRFSRLPADRILVEKTPGHLFQLGRIKRVFPESRVVLIKREPWDVIWSMIQENPFWRDSPRDLDQAIELYNSYALAQGIYYGYDAVVSYESLWSNPVKELERLLDTLRLDSSQSERLVVSAHKGISLPAELGSVFRSGAPNEGRANFSALDKKLLQDRVYDPQIQSRHLSVLIATNHLIGWTGTETLLLTLIDALLNANCKLTVYARYWNAEWLDENFDSRIRVTNDLATLKGLSFDLAHVQQGSSLVDVRAMFPDLPVVFSSLGVLPFLEQPLPFEVGVARYLAVSEEVAKNLVSSGVSRECIDIFRNVVSSELFYQISPIRDGLERILVLSYKIDEKKKGMLREAAERVGASIKFVGGAGGCISHKKLCEEINEADVVVSLGRGVIEAMFCGRVPFVFDIHGGDGLVTPGTFDELKTCNFSGRRYAKDYTVDELVKELMLYRCEFGRLLQKKALVEFGLDCNMPKLIRIYKDVALGVDGSRVPEYVLPMLRCFSRLSQEDRAHAVQYQRQCVELESRMLSEISRVKSSVSWRVTAPLRVLWNVCLKLKLKFFSEQK